MAENPYFSRVMDAVDLIAGENIRKKRLAEAQQYKIGILQKEHAFKREMANKQIAGEKDIQMLQNAGDLAEIKKKEDIRKEGLVALSPEIEKKYPALAGFGKIWKPSEAAMIVKADAEQQQLGDYQTNVLNERKRHNLVIEGKTKTQSGVGSSDPRKRLEALRKEAVDLLKSGYYGDYMKESANRTQVTAYVEKLDELLKKQRSGKLTTADQKEIDDIESFLVYSSKQDKRQAAGQDAVNRLTEILGRLEKEL